MLAGKHRSLDLPAQKNNSEVPTTQQKLSAKPQEQMQPALQSSIQQLGQQPGNKHQASSLPQAPATDSFEINGSEPDSPLGSIKSKTSMVEKGKSGNPGSEKGSFLYNGAQIMGAAGAMGLQTVMHFGGQHHSGLGVPAVGMALLGYVAQSQLGFGNSEITCRAKAFDDAEGIMKIIADDEAENVLGVHIMSPDAGEPIHEAVLALQYGTASEDIACTGHAHTYHERGFEGSCYGFL